MRRSGYLILCLLVLVSSAAAAARADSSPPPSSSAIDQYVEQIPTAGGGQATGVGKTHQTKLSTKQSRAIDRSGGKDSTLLKQVATSSAYGAPQESSNPVQTTPAQARPVAKPKSLKPARKPAARQVTTTASSPIHDRPPVSRPSDRISLATSASAAIRAVGSGNGGRILGLGIAMFLVTAFALAGTLLRQRRSY